MTRPTTPLWTRPGSSSGLPGYSAEPPSYSGTPNQRTPTGPQNNGPSARLLSSMDDTEYRPYVQPLQSHSPKRPSPSYRRPENLRKGNESRDESCDDHGKRPVNKDDADLTLFLSSASSPTGRKPKPLRKPVPKAEMAARPLATASSKDVSAEEETSSHSSLPIKDHKAPALFPEAVPKEEAPKNSTTLKVHFKNPSSSVKSSSPISPRRSYHPASSASSTISRPQSPSILDTAPKLTPTAADSPSYLPYIPARGSPTRSIHSLARTSSDASRPPPSDIPYEPASINGSPRPGTPSSRYSSSPKRPLPPAPLFAGNQAASNSSANLAESTSIPIRENEDDVFSSDGTNADHRPSLKSMDSYQSASTLTEDLYDEKNDELYGPAPQGRQERRRGARQAQMAKKEVRLINGELILECKIPTILHSFLPRRDDVEFTHMRYTAVTCDPDDFVLQGYKLRQNIGSTTRETELFICITMYNEDEIDFTRTMHGVMRNVSHFCSRLKSRTWGKDGWQKIVVCIVSDGRRKVHPRTLDALAAMGVYQDGIAKNLVNQREVTAHVYEYTTQVSLDQDLKFKGAEKGIVPCQMIFCLKEKNQKKLNSHRWFFNAFGKALSPNVCILLDVGTKPGPTSLYHLWKAFDTDSTVAGACGEIKAMKGKGWLGLLNPLVASQNFEYKMSNILDKPLESVFGYITVLPGALSAYRYYALQNDATGHGPLSQYFKGETLHGQDADVFTANMYLAEDRILCWELVAKRDERWVLKYVKSATGETDVPGKKML